MKSIQVEESPIYGRDDDKKRIMELLLADDPTNHNGTLVCLVADHGTGKTTMLHLVYNDKIICDTFDERFFVYMPKQFDEKFLMRLILESVTRVSCDITDLEILEELVKEELTDMKFLLVLDDFENTNQKCWNVLSMILNVCAEGSAVLVSTTRQCVANINGSIQYYSMNYISNQFCWMIFQQCVSFGDAIELDPDLVEIGKKHVGKCRNVILCVKALGGLLGLSVTKEWWNNVFENGSWEMDGDILPILRVSYDFLAPNLKKCFKYCSLYPKNYLFQKQHLVLMWLSQGYIEPREGRELEEIGLEYFDELLSRSFFQHSPFHETKDKFLLPGLIHELAHSVSINECFRSEGCVQKVPENACHLSLVPYEYQSILFKDLTREAQDLQTVMVVTGSALQQESISSPIVNLVDLDDLFIKYVNLATLDLSNSDIEELPKSISSLKNLHYLGFNNTKIKCIPSEISNCHYLETLEANNCHYLEELPENIHELVNLRHLNVTKESRSVIMPCGIGKLVNLRTLTTFNVGIDQSHCRIEELEKLNYLKGSLKIYGLENVTNGINAKEADLINKVYLEILSLHWSDIITCDEGDEGVEIAIELLENLEPPHSIRELIIRNYPAVIFPLWIEFPAFSNLVSIILDNCYNCENFPNLGRLPLLRYLSIQKMYAVQKLDLYNGYPSLEILNVGEMYEFEEWAQIEDGDFPRLHTLSINKCPFLRNIPHFPSIIQLAIYNCTQLPGVIELPSLRSLKIEGFLKTKSIKLPKYLPLLEKLEISQCSELSYVEGLSESNYVENIKITRCPKLDVSKTQHSLQLKEKNDPSILERGKEINLIENLRFESKKSQSSVEVVHPSASNMEGENKLLSKKRKGRGELSMLVSDLVQGEEEIKKLEQHLHEQHQLTALELLENVQTTIMQAMDTATGLGLDSDLASPAHSQQGSRSCSGMTEEVQSRLSEHVEVQNKRRVVKSPKWTIQTHQLDDGYHWRKYGQKDVLGSKFPRSYFRCTHKFDKGCKATKHVQPTDGDPNIFDVTYFGEHTCLFGLPDYNPGASSILDTKSFVTEVTDVTPLHLGDSPQAPPNSPSDVTFNVDFLPFSFSPF